MSDFDDSGLRDQLQRLAGHSVDDDAAYALLVSRVRIAKRRRMAVVTGTVGAILLVGIVATTFGDNESRSISPVANSGVDPVITLPPTTHPTVTLAPTTTIEPATTTTLPATTVAPTEPPTTPPVATVAEQPSGGQGGSSSSNSSNQGNSNGSGHSTATTTPSGSSTTNDSSKHTFTSDGGSVVVTVKDGRLTLVTSTPKPGFQAVVDKNEIDRIRVYFVGSHDRYQVEIRVRNGTAFSSVSSDGDNTMNTFDFPSSRGEEWPGSEWQSSNSRGSDSQESGSRYSDSRNARDGWRDDPGTDQHS